MSWGTRQFTLKVTGDKDEIDPNVAAYIAGLRVAGWIADAENGEDVGPDGVDAPPVNAPMDGMCTVSTPNFVQQENVVYTLERSENGFVDTETLIANCSPNQTTDPISYTGNTQFRVTAYDENTFLTTPGQPSSKIP